MSCLRRICKRKKIKEVYVLELINYKFYVGESYNKKRRIWVHENGNGSSWTKKHGVIQELKPITKKQDVFWELNETLEMMNLLGIDNVRGSMFSNPNELSIEEKILAAQLYCEKYNLCRRCGSGSHFIGQCNTLGIEAWVYNFGGILQLPKRKCLECFKDISDKPMYHKYCKRCYSNREKINET